MGFIWILFSSSPDQCLDIDKGDTILCIFGMFKGFWLRLDGGILFGSCSCVSTLSSLDTNLRQPLIQFAYWSVTSDASLCFNNGQFGSHQFFSFLFGLYWNRISHDRADQYSRRQFWLEGMMNTCGQLASNVVNQFSWDHKLFVEFCMLILFVLFVLNMIGVFVYASPVRSRWMDGQTRTWKKKSSVHPFTYYQIFSLTKVYRKKGIL